MMMARKQAAQLTPRQQAEQQFKAARISLLTAICLTVINILLLFTGMDWMLLYSVTAPYFIAVLGAVMENPVMLTTGAVIGVVCLVPYLLCWLLSKKHSAWLIVATVLMGLDTLVLIGVYLLLGDFSGILDFVFHGLIIYYMILGVVGAKKLKTLPEEEPADIIDQIVDGIPEDVAEEM